MGSTGSLIEIKINDRVVVTIDHEGKELTEDIIAGAIKHAIKYLSALKVIKDEKGVIKTRINDPIEHLSGYKFIKEFQDDQGQISVQLETDED